MFPKGKYNTGISRNAQYTVMFRSPSDRKQIDITAEQIFAKDKSRFMEVYHRETAKPYGYIMVDSHPQTPPEKQVVADFFGTCHCYPYILPSCVETQPTTKDGLKAPRKRKQCTVNPANKRSKKGWEPRSTWKPFEETAEGDSDLSDGELSDENLSDEDLSDGDSNLSGYVSDILDEELTDEKLSNKEYNIQEYNPPTPFKSGRIRIGRAGVIGSGRPGSGTPGVYHEQGVYRTLHSYNVR